MKPSLGSGSSLELQGAPEASLCRGDTGHVARAGRLLAWVASLALLVFFQTDDAAAQLVCSASSGSCAGQRLGTPCDSGSGSNAACTGVETPLLCCTGAGTGNCEKANCTLTGFVGIVPNCACPDISCGPGECFETKYGLGAATDWDVLTHGLTDELVAAGEPVPNPTHEDFEGSYVLTRGGSAPSITACNLGEGGFAPLMGTWIMREKVGCDPFDTATNPQGCPVKLALDVNLDDPTRPEHVFTERRPFADFNFCNPLGGRCEMFGNVASAGTGFGVGFRVPNPGGPAGSTRVSFSLSMGTPGGGASRLCCNSQAIDVPDLCTVLLGAAGGVDKYPLIGEIPNTSDVYVNFAPLIFDGDPAFPPFGKFSLDKSVILSGARYGVCKNNRTRPCDCGPTGSGTAAGCTANGDESDPCPGLGDICDLSEVGWRLNPAQRILTPGHPNYGQPNPGTCAKTPYVFRGTPNQDCLIGTMYAEDGDPGPDCSVLNFGSHQRPDLDCNGVVDDLNARAGSDDDGNDDYCPNYSETNMTADRDGNGRGDECECGDANLDGTVNVADIVAVNTSIFNPPWYPTLWFHQPPYAPGQFRRILTPLMDANNSTPDLTPSPAGDFDKWGTGGEVNVSDMVEVNLNIFNLKSARCGRSPVRGE